MIRLVIWLLLRASTRSAARGLGGFRCRLQAPPRDEGLTHIFYAHLLQRFLRSACRHRVGTHFAQNLEIRLTVSTPQFEGLRKVGDKDARWVHPNSRVCAKLVTRKRGEYTPIRGFAHLQARCEFQRCTIIFYKHFLGPQIGRAIKVMFLQLAKEYVCDSRHSQSNSLFLSSAP